MPLVDAKAKQTDLIIKDSNSVKCAGVYNIGATMFSSCQWRPRTVHVYIPHNDALAITDISATFKSFDEISQDNIQIYERYGKAIAYDKYPDDQRLTKITITNKAMTKESGLMMYLSFTTISQNGNSCKMKISVHSD